MGDQSYAENVVEPDVKKATANLIANIGDTFMPYDLADQIIALVSLKGTAAREEVMLKLLAHSTSAIERSDKARAQIKADLDPGHPPQLELQVDHHPTGRLTLKERTPGQTLWSDVNESHLFANLDAMAFYRAVAARLAYHAAHGSRVVRFTDSVDF